MMDICRLCLGKVDVNNPLFGGGNDILKKVLTLFPLEISEFDCLPKMVCHNCSCKVNDMANFCKIVTEADHQLRKQINYNSKSEELHNEIINRNKYIKVEVEFEQAKPNLTKSTVNEMVDQTTQTEFIQYDSNSEGILEKAPMNDDDMTIKKEEVKGNIDDEIKYNDGNLDDYLSSDDNISLIHFSTTKHFVKQELVNPSIKNEMVDPKLWKKREKKLKLESDWPQDVRHKTRRKNARKKCAVKKEWTESKKKTARNAVKKVLDDGKSPEVSSQTDKTWKCLTCFVCVDTRINLLAHYKQHVAENGNHVSSKEAGDEKQDSETTPEYIIVNRESGEGFLCTRCNKVFTAKKFIRKHLMSHIQDRAYVCNMCGRTYDKAYEIVLHGRAHSGGHKTLFCNHEDCTYSTVYKGALISHQRKHDDNFKYKCKICQKGFDVLTWFNEHHNVHTGVKPFKCDRCEKCFVYSRYLTSHRKSVHPESFPPTTKRLPHKCTECGKETASRKTLRRHMHRHAATELVLCDICGKGLSSREHLKIHRQIHLGVKPHVCRTCGKAFVKKCNMKLHERVHSGERPHVCTHCGKAFLQRSMLVIHERYHSGARPYKCDVCQKAFVARRLLSIHQKTCC